MDTKLQEEFNERINLEFNSAYLYFAMSTYFSEIYMSGFSSFMKEIALEKLNNAQTMYDYLVLRDEKLIFEKITEPDSDWINISDVFSVSLSHEEYIQEKTRELFKIAQETNDVGVMSFLKNIIIKSEFVLSKLRKMVFRIKNSNIIPTSIELLDNAILEECSN